MGDHRGREAEEGGVECEDALDVREEEGDFVFFPFLSLGGVGMSRVGGAGHGGVAGEIGRLGIHRAAPCGNGLFG